jgi:hypothetical protein
MFAGMGTKDLLYMGGGALVDGILCRTLPQMLSFLTPYNTGLMGYGLNAVTGGAIAFALGKFNRRAGQGAWIGTIVAIGQRVISDHFGSGTAAATGGMSGDLDMDLGYYTQEGFPYPQGAAGGPYTQFPGTPYAGQAAFPTTSASAVRAGQSAAAAALNPASAAGTVTKAGSMSAAGWDAHGWT